MSSSAATFPDGLAPLLQPAAAPYAVQMLCMFFRRLSAGARRQTTTVGLPDESGPKLSAATIACYGRGGVGRAAEVSQGPVEQV
jgi:hypothetical protein